MDLDRNAQVLFWKGVIPRRFLPSTRYHVNLSKKKSVAVDPVSKTEKVSTHNQINMVWLPHAIACTVGNEKVAEGASTSINATSLETSTSA